MATIVTNRQPSYSPLLGQLAGSFLMPLMSKLGDQLFNSGRREKELALAKWAGQELQGQGQPQREMDYSMSTPMMDRFSRIGGGEEQYNGEMTPFMTNVMPGISQLEHFDRSVAGNQQSVFPGGPGTAGEAGVNGAALPPVMGKGAAPLSYADLLARVDQKRFRLLDMDTVHKILGMAYEDYQRNIQSQRIQDFINNDFDSSNMNQLLKLMTIGGMDRRVRLHGGLQ